MKSFKITIIFLLAFILIQGAAQAELSNEQELACEAILCLSSGERPDECDAALDYFFSIHKKKPSDTRNARKSFLKKCPDSDADEGMSSLVDVLVNYNCSDCMIEKLNKRFIAVKILVQRRRYGRRGEDSIRTVRVVDPVMPTYCLRYYAAISNHEYTAYSQYSQTPVYFGSNIGQRTRDNDGNEYYKIYARSSREQSEIAAMISNSNNHWEWNK